MPSSVIGGMTSAPLASAPILGQAGTTALNGLLTPSSVGLSTLNGGTAATGGGLSTAQSIGLLGTGMKMMGGNGQQAPAPAPIPQQQQNVQPLRGRMRTF
jgi:hypothetical protein